MKNTGIIVTVLVLLGALLLTCSRAAATTDGVYTLSNVSATWDATYANRYMAPIPAPAGSSYQYDYDHAYGDESTVTYNLPWPFTFYGQTYTQITADTNGNVWFTATGTAHSFNLASTGRGPVIAVWNNDHSSYYYGGVYVQHKTNSERVVIEWQTESYTEEGSYRPNNFEVVLFRDGTINFNYNTIDTAFFKDYGSGISKGDGSASLNLTASYGNVSTLAALSFLYVPNTPKLFITPESDSFGSIYVNNSSSLHTFTVNNAGIVNLVLGTITFTGANPVDFIKSADTCSGMAIAPSASCTFKVAFAPQTGGAKTATVSIPSNDPTNSLLGVPLNGIGAVDTTPPITTASPVGSTYSAAQTVTLSANETATIYYTTNGTTPTTSSSVYSAPLIVSSTTTLNYFAKDLAGNSEAVKSQTYTIQTGSGTNYSQNFDAISTIPAGWSGQGPMSISTMYHSAAKSFLLGDGFNDGSVSFVAPTTGNFSFWYYKVGTWGYYWYWSLQDYSQYGTDVGSMTVSINGAVVYTVTADTGWVKTPLFSVHAGDTIKIAQIGSYDDGGAYCGQIGGECDEGDDRYDNVFVYIDDIAIEGTTSSDTIPPVTTATPVGTTFSSTLTVFLTANESATIYYTTNGASPTTASSVYSAPLMISATTTLKYFAKDLAGNVETVKSQVYTYFDATPPITTVSPVGGTYITPKTVSLTANEPATIYYITNGTTPTTGSSVYSAPLTISATTTLKYFAKDGAGNIEAVKTQTYTIDSTAATTTATPVGGAYSSTQTVTLTTNETATIYYTVDGTTPTTSSPVYSAPLTVSATTVLKYFAKDLAGNIEQLKSQTYTIQNAGGSGYTESFDSSTTLPTGWSGLGLATISTMYHSAARSLQLGNGYNTDGTVSFVAPVTGNFSFWYTKSSGWGYYYQEDDWYEVGTNVGTMKVLVNGSVVYTASVDSGWISTPLFSVHAGDTIRIEQAGNRDDDGLSCNALYRYKCEYSQYDPYYNISVYIDDVIISGGN